MAIQQQPFLRVNFGANTSGSRPGMMEIVDAISRQIESDPSAPGCRLPPIRVLAHQLGISKNTVDAAYEELKAKSLIESKGRTGLFVARSEKAHPAKARKTVPLPPFKSFANVGISSTSRDGILSMSSVFIDPRLLPKERVRACFKSVLQSPGLSDYSDLQGYLPLRRKIAERLRKRGIDAQPEQIVTTIGSMQVIDLVSRSLERVKIATENPAFYVGKALFEMNGIPTIGLPVDPFSGAKLDEWERVLKTHRPKFAYLTTNFQNPTGYSYTSREMNQILEWSRQYGFGILEDDWGSDMLSFSEFKPSLRALGGDNVIYMNAFTKKLLPSLRIGYALASEKTLPALLHAKRVSISSVPAIVEAALFEFLDRGYYDAHLKRLQSELDSRYQRCLALLRELMPEDVRWTTPGGGPILWLECPKRVTLEKLTTRLQEKRVLIQPSFGAFFGKPHLHGFKLGYAFLAPEEMERGLARIAEELRTSKGRQATS